MALVTEVKIEVKFDHKVTYKWDYISNKLSYKIV